MRHVVLGLILLLSSVQAAVKVETSNHDLSKSKKGDNHNKSHPIGLDDSVAQSIIEAHFRGPDNNCLDPKNFCFTRAQKFIAPIVDAMRQHQIDPSGPDGKLDTKDDLVGKVLIHFPKGGEWRWHIVPFYVNDQGKKMVCDPAQPKGGSAKLSPMTVEEWIQHVAPGLAAKQIEKTKDPEPGECFYSFKPISFYSIMTEGSLPSANREMVHDQKQLDYEILRSLDPDRQEAYPGAREREKSVGDRISELVKSLANTDPHIRYIARRKLQQMEAKSVPALTESLVGRNADARMEAALALVSMNNVDAWASVTEALYSKDSKVRLRAVAAVATKAELGGAVVIHALNHGGRVTTESANWILQEVESAGRSFTLLIKAAQRLDTGRDSEKALKQVMANLSHAVGAPQCSSLDAALGLAKIPKVPNRKALQKLLQNASEGSGAMAEIEEDYQYRLQRFKEKVSDAYSALHTLAALFQGPMPFKIEAAVQVLAAMPRNPTPNQAISQALKHANPDIRLTAAIATGEINKLETFLADPNPDRRAAARRALFLLGEKREEAQPVKLKPKNLSGGGAGLFKD